MSYNYFELLHLMPDGPQANNTKIIQKALESWEKTTHEAFGNASKVAEKRELKSAYAKYRCCFPIENRLLIYTTDTVIFRWIN